MSNGAHNHPRTGEAGPSMPYGGRQPGAMRYITKLEATITANDEQLKEARRQIMWHSALVEDLQDEAALYQQALADAGKQNMILRRRLGLPEAGDIEYTEEELEFLNPPEPEESAPADDIEASIAQVTAKAALAALAVAPQKTASRKRKR